MNYDKEIKKIQELFFVMIKMSKIFLKLIK